MLVKIKKLHSEVNLPVYKTIGAACADIQAYFKYKQKLLSLIKSKRILKT